MNYSPGYGRLKALGAYVSADGVVLGAASAGLLSFALYVSTMARGITWRNLGADGGDLILGDHGRIDFGFDDDAAPTTSSVERVEGVLELAAGADTIDGNAGADTILGGSESDLLRGDDASGASGDFDLGDLIFGDNGEIDYAVIAGAISLLTRVATRDVSSATGAGDVIDGNAAGDTILGGIGSDILRGDKAAVAGILDGDIVLARQQETADRGEIVVALSETIRIMAEIDEVIEAHGGWPGAFQA